MTLPDVRESWHLAGEIGQDLYDDFWAKSYYRYGSPAVDYEAISLEDGEALGLPEDDPYLTILRRKSDGQLFEIEIEVTARAIETPSPGQQDVPGQQELVTP